MSLSKNGPLQLTRTDFNPAPADVFAVRRMLQKLLPPELILDVLSLASYCPRLESVRQLEARYAADDHTPGNVSVPSIAGLYLTTPALPGSCVRAKGITFQIQSADQGWATFGGEGTYDNSHTWFEASIIRPLPGVPTATGSTSINMGPLRTPEECRHHLRFQGWEMVERNGTIGWKVHNCITASRDYRYYRVDWVAGIPTEVDDPRAMGDGAGFLELLRPGDSVALWARAEQILWVNKVRAATIEIEYDV